MEALSLALAILPIVVEVLKAYRIAYQHLRTFRHYSREVKRVCIKFRIQECLFTHELELLLTLTTKNTDQISSLLADLEHPQWKSESLAASIRRRLGKNAEVYYDLVESIKQQLDKLQADLSCFDALTQEQTPGEKIKHTIIRLKSAARISFDKRQYEERIDALRQDNEDLRNIGSYLSRSQFTAITRTRPRALPDRIQKARSASIALYESLRDCWSCANPDHREHAAKLCLEAKVEESVRLDLALSCTKHTSSANISLPAPPLWLYVRTLTDSAADRLFSTPGDLGGQREALPRVPDDLDCEHRNKRVRLSVPTSLVRQNLRRSPSFCDDLAQCQCMMGTESCLGFVETGENTTENFRQMFYHHCTQQPSLRSNTTATTLVDALSGCRYTMTMEQQLELAQKLVIAVLSLHSTPWLSDQWRTSDISSFAAPAYNDELFLQTLHVNTKISGTTPKVISNDLINMTDSDSSQQTLLEWQEVQCLYNVPNIMLFSLGIALLEIAHQQPLESFRLDRDPNNIFTARRLAQKPSIFGPKYQRLAQRCLQCDFGCGSDLSHNDLQGAVYGDVVGQLDEMLAGFKIS